MERWERKSRKRWGRRRKEEVGEEEKEEVGEEEEDGSLQTTTVASNCVSSSPPVMTLS